MHSFQNGKLMDIIYYQQEEDMVKQQNEVHAYIKELEQQHESHGEEAKNDELKVFGSQTFTCSKKLYIVNWLKQEKIIGGKLYEPTINWSQKIVCKLESKTIGKELRKQRLTCHMKDYAKHG